MTARLVVPYYAYEVRMPPTRTWEFQAPDGSGGAYAVGGYATKGDAQRAADWQREADERAARAAAKGGGAE